MMDGTVDVVAEAELQAHGMASGAKDVFAGDADQSAVWNQRR
jgi:hypothetical protein